ncbi:APC family permease [Mycoplasmoides pneumoniae]|uniref:APC family permease n=1 Tax=Mycoplasmoides pneumoniae TaxID=2104 RepID=UPI001330FA60|nr:APC family permease [Mycoplasmoides pneumoniae]
MSHQEQLHKPNRQQFSEKQFIAFAFNYVAGFGFISVVLTMFKLGPFSYLILGLAALGILGVMLSFSRLSIICGSKAYGGSYLIAKKALGAKTITARFFTFLSGWNVSLTGPFNGLIVPAVLVLSFADIKAVKDNNGALIGLLVGGFVLFGALNFISLFGLKMNKNAILFFAIVKWVVVLGGLILGIYLIGTNHGHGFVENNTLGEHIEDLSFLKVISTTVGMLVAFAGTEDLTAITPDVKSKNIRKCFLLMFGAVTLLYLIGFVIISGISGLNGYGLDGKEKNEKAINTFGSIYFQAGGKYLGIPLLVIFGLGFLLNSLASRLGMTITTARKYVALAQDGFLPSFINEQNKHHEYHKAVWASNIMTLAVMVLMIIVPFLPNDENPGKQLVMFDAISVLVEVAIELAVLISLIQYFITYIFFFMILAKKEGSASVSWWEIASYGVSFAIITVLLFVNLFPITAWKNTNTFKLSILAAFFALGIGFFIHSEIKNKGQLVKSVECN